MTCAAHRALCCAESPWYLSLCDSVQPVHVARRGWHAQEVLPLGKPPHAGCVCHPCVRRTLVACNGPYKSLPHRRRNERKVWVHGIHLVASHLKLHLLPRRTYKLRRQQLQLFNSACSTSVTASCHEPPLTRSHSRSNTRWKPSRGRVHGTRVTVTGAAVRPTYVARPTPTSCRLATSSSSRSSSYP